MKKKSIPPVDSAELRRRAEERLKEKLSNQGAEEKGKRREEDAQRLIQELQIHQIELEMQNEELAKSRAEVEEGLALYTELYDFAPVGYFNLDTEGVIRRMNLSGARLLGLERAQLIGRLFSVFISQADLNDFNAFLKNTFKDLTKQTCEVTLRRKEKVNPSTIPSVSSLMGESDELIISIEAIAVKNAQECRAVMKDITEHRRVENIFQSLLMEIHNEKNRLSALINAMTDEVWFADTQKSITIANTSARKSISLDPKQTIGVNELAKSVVVFRPDGSTMPVEEAPPLRALLGEVIINQEQIVKLPKSGELQYREVNAAPVKDSQGIIIGSVTVIRDITERKQAEEKRIKLLAELARSNKDLEQFAYVASHDLQQPLQIISGFTQLLASRYGDKLDQKARDYIDFVVTASNRMQKMIQDLLTYSRVTTQVKPSVTTDTGIVLDETLANLQVAISDSGASVIHDALPVVMANHSQLVEVFQNLIGNAIKFRKDSPLLIHVSAVKIEDEWVFSVKDNGMGIEPQYFERIFILFERLHAGETYPGNGIGLALCKRIIQELGGRIWVESKPGKGSTFYFTLKGVE